ncbi:uncharacterized protein LOC143540842 [Bidens hawaiensis]|uniref:uncharacterized protein LOC143540842 n=1 Tax=Bidens hawaiensis TaxID=980011 RepID=UPI0040492815
MTCKKHCTDISSINGVCASCLRQRLITLIITQEQSETQSLDHNHRNSNPPRSGSPYTTRQKYTKPVNPVLTAQRPCNKPRFNHSVSDRRFYNSPQIAITTGGCIGGSSSSRKNPTVIKFPSISNLFRSNSRNVDTDSNPRVSVSVSVSTSSGATSSPSWLSNVLPGAGVRQKSNTAAGVVRNRGMSPVQTSDDEFSGGSAGNPTPVVRCGGGQFRPVVRASPNGRLPVDGGYSGDVRVPAAVAVPHLSYAKSFSGNRSRKLADFGRSDPNRLF